MPAGVVCVVPCQIWIRATVGRVARILYSISSLYRSWISNSKQKLKNRKLPLPLGEGRGEGLAKPPPLVMFFLRPPTGNKKVVVHTSHYALTPALSQRERELPPVNIVSAIFRLRATIL